MKDCLSLFAEMDADEQFSQLPQDDNPNLDGIPELVADSTVTMDCLGNPTVTDCNVKYIVRWDFHK
jgi:hypothetical protein